MRSTHQLFQDALAAFQFGKFHDAERLFKKVLKKDPNNVAALNLVTVVLMKMEQFEDAETYIARAVQINQSSDVSYYNYGLILKQLKKPMQALEQFSNALRINSQVPEAWNNRGAVFNELKQYENAVADFDKAILINGKYAEAICNRGKSLIGLKRFEEALATYESALSLNPYLAEAWLGRGIALTDLKRLDEAFSAHEKALSLKPDLAEAWVNRGIVLAKLKRFGDALSNYDRALSLKPDLADAWLGRGFALTGLKRFEEASSAHEKALSLKPDLTEAWLGRGFALTGLKRFEEAFSAHDKALSSKPDLAEAWLGRGIILAALKQFGEALSTYDRALSLQPDLADAWLNRGIALAELKRFDDAFSAYDKALSLDPDLADAWLGRGNSFAMLRHYDKAFSAYDRALSLKPDLAEAWCSRGFVLAELKRFDDAFSAYDRALSLKPDLAEAWFGRGDSFAELRQFDQALPFYERAFALDPDLVGLASSRLHTKMQICDWINFADESRHLISSVREETAKVAPFVVVGISSSPEEHLISARSWATKFFPPSEQPLWNGEVYNHDKIRVAYVSADFRTHPVSSCIAGMFECHDKTRFDLTAISIGPDDESDVRKRLESSFDRFIDARPFSDDEIAAQIRKAEIDILIDLNGFTQGARTSIFRFRPAPLQVSYLGYPGTMGAAYMDYMIADKIVIPDSQRAHYTEKVVYLPNSYQVNDSKRLDFATESDRRLHGLPLNAFVFCCFNNNYKMTPDVFDSWMRILARVDGSVIWLLADNATAAANLRKEAASRGIVGERLIFAKRALSVADHVARQGLADVFLDTLPYNAHATAADALLGGLPVITQAGQTFAGRVAASLLTAIGMPELISSTPEAYEELAVELAGDAEKLAIIKRKLAANRLTMPLFNTSLFTRHIEAGYIAMLERYEAGLPPADIYVEQ